MCYTCKQIYSSLASANNCLSDMPEIHAYRLSSTFNLGHPRSSLPSLPLPSPLALFYNPKCAFRMRYPTKKAYHSSRSQKMGKRTSIQILRTPFLLTLSYSHLHFEQSSNHSHSHTPNQEPTYVHINPGFEWYRKNQTARTRLTANLCRLLDLVTASLFMRGACLP
jgi:hypothetical protein